jgi:hypothetical protein
MSISVARSSGGEGESRGAFSSWTSPRTERLWRRRRIAEASTPYGGESGVADLVQRSEYVGEHRPVESRVSDLRKLEESFARVASADKHGVDVKKVSRESAAILLLTASSGCSTGPKPTRRPPRNQTA